MNRFNEDFLAAENGYADTMRDVILPFLDSRRQKAAVRGEDGAELYAVRYDADEPIGTVLLVHGFTENEFKFAEVTYSLLKNGFSVAAYDQRGHGRSWRDPAIHDLSLTHVDRFSSYVEDMEQVMAHVVSSMPRPHMVFCHSMGGAVTACYMEKHPADLHKAAMCSPMIAPDRGGVPFLASRLICRVGKLAGNGKKRMFISKPYSGPEDYAASCATSRARFDWYDAVKAKEPLFQNNGPSYSWTFASLGVSERILFPGRAEKIRTSVRLYSASLDNTVLPSAQRMFSRRLKHGAMITVQGAKHEIYRSEDKVLYPWWHDVLTFLKT